MVTIKQIAELAGVSRGTVDRVLNGRPGVKPETEQKIRAIAEEMGYSPNTAGRILAAGKKQLKLAFLICHGPEFTYFQDVLAAAQEKAVELRGLGVAVRFYLITHFAPDYLSGLLAQVEADEPDGIAALPLRTAPFLEFMERVTAKGIPTVFFNLDEDFAPRLCYVGCDYEQAGRVAAGLAALCAGQQGVVGLLSLHTAGSTSFNERVYGFTDELRTHYPALTLANHGKVTVVRHGDYAAAETMIRSHPELSAVYIVNLGDYQVCRAVREAADGRPLRIITNDLVPVQRKMLHQGIISATLSQQPEVQGSAPLQILYEYLALGIPPKKDRYLTQLSIHIPQNS